MAAQAFTNFSGSNGASNQPTSYLVSDGFTGPNPTSTPNNPSFGPATFPGGLTVPPGTTIHGGSTTASLALAVTAVTNTDLTMSLPAGAIIQSMVVYTTTAFTGNTSNVTIQIGSAAGGAQYVAATRIDAIGVVTLTPVAAQAASLLSLPAGTPNFFIRIVQAASATAVGAGKLVVTYVIP